MGIDFNSKEKEQKCVVFKLTVVLRALVVLLVDKLFDSETSHSEGISFIYIHIVDFMDISIWT